MHVTSNGTFELVGDSGSYSPYRMGTWVNLELPYSRQGYGVVCSVFPEDAAALHESGEKREFVLEVESEECPVQKVVTDFARGLEVSKLDDIELVDSSWSATPPNASFLVSTYRATRGGTVGNRTKSKS